MRVSINSGTFALGSDSSPNANLGGNVTVVGGALTGFGTIFGNLTNSGLVQPGGSIGTLTVNSNYAQASSGTLAIEVSLIANSQLRVGGSANLRRPACPALRSGHLYAVHLYADPGRLGVGRVRPGNRNGSDKG